MPSPELEARARQLLASPNVSPELKARLQEKMAAYERRRAPSPPQDFPRGNDSARQAGAPMPALDEDVFAARVAAATRPVQRAPEEVAMDRERLEAGSGAGQAMAAAEGGLRGLSLGTSDPAAAALTGAAHALTSNGVPQLTPEARAKAAELGIKLPGVDERGTFERGYDSAREQQDLRRAANPGTAVATELAGAFMPALASGGTSLAAYTPTALAGRAGAAAAGKLVAPGLARSALGGGLSGAVAGGVTSAAGGGDAGDVASSAGLGFGLGSTIGVLTRGAQWLGQRMQRGLRDPNTDRGRALELAEKAGARTDVVQGLKPGPRLDALTEEATGTGIAPESLAAERAGGELGSTLATRQEGTLSRIAAQNEAVYSQGRQAIMTPTGRAGLEELRRYSHADGRPLPGANLRAVAEKVRGAGKVKVVDINSADAHAADPADTMEVGLARQLGLLPRSGASTRDADKVVVFEWDLVSPQQLDDTTRALSDSAKEAANTFSPSAAPVKRLAAAARQNREGFGEDWQATKAQQSSELERMRNEFEAAGLPRNLDDIDLGDFGTKEALFRGVARYRTKGNLVADRELDRLAEGNDRLRKLLDEAAGSRSAAQLSGGPVDPKVAAGAGGLRTFGVGSGLRMRIDPIMGALAEARGAIPAAPAAAAVELARQQRRRVR